MDTVRRVLRSKVTWVVAGIGLLIGVYALLGFHAAPRLVRGQAIDFVRETYGRNLELGDIRIHPFKLQAEVHDLSLPDADGSPMLAFRRLFVDFEAVSSVWERAFVFREVTLDAPDARAILRKDGSLNLADLVPPDDEEADEGPLPAVWIQSFALTGGTVYLLNDLRRRPVQRHFSPVTFSLQDFRTTPEGGGFRLAARSRQDELFEWKGRFALEPRISSTGEFSITDLRVPGLAEFIGDDLPFRLPRGEIDLGGSYELDVGDTVSLDVALPRIVMSDLALRARGVEEDWVAIPSIEISDTKLAVPASTVAVDRVAVQGLTAKAWMDADGTLSIDRLFAAAPATATERATSTASATTATTTVTAASGDTSNDLRLTVGRVELRSAALDFEDRTVEPAARFVLSPFDVSVRNASLDLTRPLPVEFATTVNGAARLSGAGEVMPGDAAVDVAIELAGFEVADLQSYANGATDLTIRRGTIDARGRFTTMPPGSGKPELGFTGDVAIAGFRSTDNALEQDFLNFERVELEQLRFALAPDVLSIDRVRVVRPFARVIVSSDQVLNVAAVFDPEGTAAALAQRKAEAARKSAESSRRKTRAEVRAEKRAAAAAAKARAQAPPPRAPELRETGMPIRVREVSVVGGTMDFADYSVQPNFAAAVQALGGKVTGLSSDPNARATVKLAGNVGEFSPVHIEGTTQPFAFDRYTDIGLRFENISLPVFNPYSGKFAGYNIAKGKLTTDLRYQIDARKLDAQHRIRIDQLEWGEATAAKGEATLPVKFATSLLKDADGVISLDIPVSGTLDDPAFRVGPIVWQVIKNLLTKAVTAPFKALGALFKGAEEAQFVDFAPGGSEVDATTTERLGALGKSLAPKPDLRLEVPIGVDAGLDGQALAQARYEQELQGAMRAVLLGKRRRADAAPALPAFDTLEPDRKVDVLTSLYRQLAGAAPAIPEVAVEPDGNLSRRERKAREVQASLDWLEAECRKRALASPSDLERLGQLRGEAIQKALLLDTGLAPGRVFLTRAGKVTANAPYVRFELAVK
ncbi:MAG TPA: DUF748 domain-containing protein [Steroidobacteraceae bacterium]|nr:DUF748 domain-containing protein [Steroidobacteraceae bacterium]